MKFRKDKQRRVKPILDLTPLIDVVFQLLIFFMLSATFVIQSSIQIEMPTAQGATQLDQKDLTITLAHGEGGPDGKGPVFIDSVEITSMAGLSEIISERLDENPNTRLLIRSDTRAEAGRLIEIMGIANSLGASTVALAAEVPDSRP